MPSGGDESSITASQDTGDGGQWKTRSRSVVEAKRRYEQTKNLPSEDSDAALQDLLSRIDDMALTHQEQGAHQKRLIAVVANRTGAQPLTSGRDPVGDYQKVLSHLDEAVHHGVSMDEARQMWANCLAILRRLFLPPVVRHAELDLLATVDSPGPGDVSALVALLAGPNHLHYFLSRIQTPAWLTVLTESELLEPPAGQAAWPAFAAVMGLKDEYDTGVAGVLQRMMERWGSQPQKAWYIARAAVDVCPHARNVIQSALHKHRSFTMIAILAIFAAASGDPKDPFVVAVGDIVLNSETWLKGDLHPEPLLAKLVEGMTAENYAARIILLCHKLQKVPSSDHDRRYFFVDNMAHLDEEVPPYRKHKPFHALLRTLVRALQKASAWADARELLGVMSPLPDDITQRVRSWLLGDAPSVKPEDLIAEVARGISSRYPTSDDLRVVDRVFAGSTEDNYIAVWAEAAGVPPTVAELSAALAAGNVPVQHRYLLRWSAILPQPVIAPWTTAIAVMSAAYGQPSRQSLAQSAPKTSGGWSQSPLSEENLQAMSPEDGAQWIAAWRPGPSQWLISPRGLGRTLQAVVKANPAGWASEPVATASLLRHPTYIHHYLQGLADAQSLSGVPVDELLDLIELVRAHPWPATALGGDPEDFDHGWRPAEHASVAVIETMAVSDLGFGSRRDEVWAILRAEIENKDEPSGLLGETFDPLETAINRPCTKALKTALSFLGHEYRLENMVRSDALGVLSSILQLEGRNGAEHRAILATRIGFLRYVAGDWVEQHRDQLFSDAAPTGLGQTTVDLAIRWGQPNRWLLENYPMAVKNAVERRVEHALEHYLVAMLRNAPGCSTQEAVKFFASKQLLSTAGEIIGRLLRSDDAPPELVVVAVQFWTLVLSANAADSLAGFGWYAEIGSIDTDTWLDLTLQTVTTTHGRIAWTHKVAERAAERASDVKTLEILNQLVRGLGDDWDKREVAKIAAQTLQKAQSLSETPQYQRLHTTLAERGEL